MNSIDCHLQLVFFTGIDLDTQQLISAGYRKFASDLCGRLASDGSPGWRTAADEEDSELVVSARFRRGNPLLPVWFLERDFVEPWLDTDLSDDAVHVLVDRATLRVFDYGVGIIMFDGRIEYEGSLPLVDVIRRVEVISDRVPMAARQIATESVQAIAAGMAALEAGRFELRGLVAGSTNRLREKAPTEAKTVQFLWVHRLFTLDRGAESLEALDDLGMMSVPVCEQVWFEGRKSATFIAGQGTSVLQGDGVQGAPPLIVEPLALLNAYYAGSQKFDEAVFEGVAQLQEISNAKSRFSAASKADEVLCLQERVLLFRAMIDHQAHNFSPQEQHVWQMIAEAWNLQPLIDGIESNVTTLDGLFRHVAEQRRSEQAETLQRFVTIFTLASVVGVAASLFPIVDGAPASLPVITRCFIFAILLLGPILIGWAVYDLVRRRGRWNIAR